MAKRLIACFDTINGRITKGYKFEDNIDIALPEEMAEKMCKLQIDEIIIFDVTASNEKRKTDFEMVRRVAKCITIPFIVGGGLKTLDDLQEAINAGANKISVDSMAVRNPEIIREGAKAFGSEKIVLSTQVKKDENFASGYQVYIDGARTATRLDAIEWIKRAEELGAGEICVNSIENDGAASGYDLELMKKAGAAVKIPLIASGGAGKPEHIYDVFTQTNADAAIISSMLYSPRLEKNYTPQELKTFLAEKGVAINPYI
ncbi:MAG: imidazole glycerol phosphate synthase cyclase subunit [Clostridiales bacterium]|jgi:cyclase|nr:imidazole glycerol phosphate synthase cyclase subunit [Clostridiales bacterium]